MAFPFISEASFEAGTTGHFDTEVDTESRLDIAHYSELARFPRASSEMPWRGAYCMRIKLENDGSPADAYLQETGSWDMTAGTNDLYGRFMLFLSADTVMANTNEFAILQFWSATNTVECGIYINYTTANGFRLGTGQDTAAATVFKPLTLGEWHTVEFFFDPAGSSASTFDCWLDGAALTQQTGFTSANITSGVIGVIGQDAGTTTGTLLIDAIVTDDARLYPHTERFPETVLLTASGHVFVGPGELENITLLSGAGTDCVMAIYDTDLGYTLAASNLVSEIKNTANNQAVPELPVRVHRGCYVALSGTNPRAIARIKTAPHYSAGAMREYGRNRKANAFGA